MPKPKASPPVAYSYVRFSTPGQAEGDSLRRQTEKAADWCERNGVRLDTATTLHDLGRSAYTGAHRVNPDRNALAAFLKLVEQGRVPRGSVLICEALDRLSREHIQPALMLLLNLLQAGIKVVQLIPVEQVFDDKSESMALMMAIMELSRGNSESRVKSERMGDAWSARRKRTRENGEVLTRALPGWVECRNGKLILNPEKARTVELIFRLAGRGDGLIAIVRKLTEAGVPNIYTRVPHWGRAYVSRILRDRRAIGEFQPRSHGKPDGNPIPNYFPPVVTEAVWSAARCGAGKVGHLRGRTGNHVDPFRGLVTSACDGSTFYNDVAPAAGGKRRLLKNLSGMEGRAKITSFPADAFESAILSRLRELDPHDVFPSDDGPDEASVLSGELAGVDAELADAGAYMEANGFSPTIGKRVTTLEKRKVELVQRLADARQRTANPIGEALGEARTLIDLLATAADPTDARTRLRSAIRRVVESVVMLVVPRKLTRLAAVQVWFYGGSRRDYVILYKHGRNGRQKRPPVQRVWSFAEAGVADYDLRDRKDVAELEKFLASVELDALEKFLDAGRPRKRTRLSSAGRTAV